ENEDAVTLKEKGIVYVPDFVLNAGGVVCVADELRGFSEARVKKHIETHIPKNVREILESAVAENSDTHTQAIKRAQKIIENRRTLRTPFTQQRETWYTRNRKNM
ncbi:MAG: leucine dehydrogenase, partial [Bacilli bacterium]